jgi:hypothetical protein
MTTRRRIKKEIDYLVSDLILDCFAFANFAKNPDDEATMRVVTETLSLRNQLRDRANHPERRGDAHSVKVFYDQLARELIAGIDSGYDKLGRLAGRSE